MLLLILALSCTLTWADSNTCPNDYLRLSDQHSFCLDPNPTCNIKNSGVSKDGIDHILKLHNKYRSQVAMGQETKAGGLPTASNMLQMVWDDELAAIAQKWANNCIYQHDCSQCRSVANFPVGQNIAYQDLICYKRQCLRSIKASDLEPDWATVIKDFYDEVKDFDKKMVPRMQSRGGKEVNHFTQIIWAKTWRIGCGFTLFMKGLTYRRFYVCNYGPAGNMIGEPIYEQGKPGSACPINSCVGGATCSGGKDYPGLCKMLDPTTAPVYSRNLNDLLFFCNSSAATEDCTATANGTNNWKYATSLQGNFITILLKGGESSTIFFKKHISPTKTDFCVRIVLKKGPYYPGEQDQSFLRADFKPVGYYPVTMDLGLTSRDLFAPFSLDLMWKAETSFSLTFSVKNGANAHELDIKEIIAFDGKCSSRNT